MDIYYILGMIGGFGIITKCIQYLLFLLFCPIIRYRYKSESGNDKFITNNICNYIIKNKWYATINVITMKKTYPVGCVLGKYFIAFIDIEGRDYNSIEPSLTIYLYSYYDIIKEIKDMKNIPNIRVDNNSIDNSVMIDSSVDNSSVDNSSVDNSSVDTCLIYNNAKGTKNIHYNISLYRKVESWIASEYECISVNFKNTFTSDIQHKCVKYIINCLKLSINNGFNNSISVLITGNSGIGKSKIAYVLASKINAAVCEDFELTEPGYCLLGLVNIAKPTNQNPLILLIDEFDVPINQIFNETVTVHKMYKPPIQNKTSCNKFLDNLSTHDNLITIFTSNKNLEWFKDKDPSFVRPGRINVHIHMDNSLLELSVLNDASCKLSSQINKSRYCLSIDKSD
jgi:hypothetical protein